MTTLQQNRVGFFLLFNIQAVLSLADRLKYFILFRNSFICEKETSLKNYYLVFSWITCFKPSEENT